MAATAAVAPAAAAAAARAAAGKAVTTTVMSAVAAAAAATILRWAVWRKRSSGFTTVVEACGPTTTTSTAVKLAETKECGGFYGSLAARCTEAEAAVVALVPSTAVVTPRAPVLALKAKAIWDELVRPSEVFAMYSHHLAIDVMAGGEEEFRGWRGYMEPPVRKLLDHFTYMRIPARDLHLGSATAAAAFDGAARGWRRRRHCAAAAEAAAAGGGEGELLEQEWEGEAEAADAARDFFVLEPVVPQWRRTALEAAGQAKRVRIQLLPPAPAQAAAR
ncbi:hypothetical protein JKP88DRAFT_352226 [Tribonema minus]|uniref:Uncharacterized protein n=1 Tax=Tribonema minus TaxID=303371 RepID=A0A835ZHW1_9STRA|nr:hypothetical protein JKP88DRAFT_352226 [Tribonema minus]